MRINVKQRSQKWLDLKKSKLGSSEVFGLVKYYITDEELQNVGINKDEFQDTPYCTAFELFHKFKNPDLYITKPFTKELSLFGQRIEEFAYLYLTGEGNKYNSETKGGGVYCDEGLIASLDFEAKANSSEIIQDANGYDISLLDIPNHLIEIKGSSQYLLKSKDSAFKGVDWKFIFQTQFAMMLSGFKWARIFIVSLLDDNQFERGYICGLPEKRALKYIRDHAELYNFIYKERPEYQYLIKTAIQRFEYDLRANNCPDLPDSFNSQLIYRLVDQKGNLLGTRKQILEMEDFNFYFDLEQKKKALEKQGTEVKKRITQMMINSGKAKIKSNIGFFSLNEKCLLARKNKTKATSKN